jgi:acid phosphatase
MDRLSALLAAALALTAAVTPAAAADGDFNVLQHLGGNAQWLPGPEVTGISSDVPEGCTVELAAFFSRHGSRVSSIAEHHLIHANSRQFPDTGAYNGWVDLYERIQAAGSLDITDDTLSFLPSWKPVLSDPTRQIGQLSPTGIEELTTMGATWRQRYPHLYEDNTPFTMWSNYYTSGPRVRDSARYFARGFLGPNAAELGTIYALNASDPASWMNSLGASDLCKAYNDEGGSPYKDVWDSIYLPPIRARLNAEIHGDFNLTDGDVSSLAYLCGFETQIVGSRSPFCDVLTEDEILQYEYAQDLRYWYGTGLGSDIEKYQMLPIVEGLVQRFVDGPNVVYQLPNSTFVPPKVIANFANDGQINQIVAVLGVFDNEPQLPANRTLPNRMFRSSRLTPMRGTVAFERLSCPVAPQSSCGPPSNNTASDAYMRIRLNEVVYPVQGCTSGPGSSCPLLEYQSIIKSKVNEVGDFAQICNMTGEGFASRPTTTFLFDNTLPFQSIVKP